MLTEQEAFEAMRYFLTEFWQRGGSEPTVSSPSC